MMLNNGRLRPFWPLTATVTMGDNMSKRLKLITASEAEMEERSFPNLYPDWEQGDPASDPEDHHNEPLDAEGEVPGRKPTEMLTSGAKLTLA